MWLATVNISSILPVPVLVLHPFLYLCRRKISARSITSETSSIDVGDPFDNNRSTSSSAWTISSAEVCIRSWRYVSGDELMLLLSTAQMRQLWQKFSVSPLYSSHANRAHNVPRTDK